MERTKKEIEELGKREFDNLLLHKINDMIFNKRRNCLIAIVGGTGTGKSLLACKISNAIDPSFNETNIPERVLRTPLQFMNLVNEDILDVGNAIMFDEAGVGISSRKWYEFSNKAVMFILQTFRYKRLLVIFTAPSLSFIDKQARALIHFIIETKKIDFKKYTTIADVRQIQHNPVLDTTYKKYLRDFHNGKRIKIKRFHFNRVSPKIAHAYDKYADSFKKDISRELLNEAHKIERIEKAKEEAKGYDQANIIQTILKNSGRYIRRYGKRMILDKATVEDDFKIGDTRSKRIKGIVEKRLKESGGVY